MREAYTVTQRVHNPNDAPINRALLDLQQLIQTRFPEATFVVSHGEDPEGIYLDAVVDQDDPDLVMDLVVERLLSLQI